ncbi:MAG: hypothetical protein KGJ11_04350, partial [Candidatus Omnitrophica bacterium]|nr:hypothetical protein [Candidatus Omnitrophota bacterium]
MKKFLILFILPLTLCLWSIAVISFARQTATYTSYPSPSGNYSKVQLSATSTANENYASSGSACFCAKNNVNTDGINHSANNCDTGRSGATYYNVGAVFTDPTTGYLEACKSDGTVASYPGTSFTRFGSGAACPSPLTPSSEPCPSNYQ